MLSGRSAAYSRSSTRRGARHCGPGSSPTGPRPVNHAPRPCSRCALVSRSATTSVTRTVHSSSLEGASESPGNLLGSRFAGLETDRRRDLDQPRRPIALLGARLHDRRGGVLSELDLFNPSDVPGDRAGDRRRPRQGTAQLHRRRCPIEVAQRDRVCGPELGDPRRHHRRERAELPARHELRGQLPARRNGDRVAETREDRGVLRGRPLQAPLGQWPRSSHRTAVQRPPHRQHEGAGRDAERLELVAVARWVEAEAAGDQAVVVRALPAVTDVQLTVDQLPGQLVEDTAAVLRAEHPVGARVVAERGSRPEVQLRQARARTGRPCRRSRGPRRPGRRPQ